MTDEQPLGFPALPINDTTYIDSIDVGTIKAGVIGSGQIKGKEIVLASDGILRSEVYTPGSAGWSINADGSAEFSDVTVRGTIEATSGELGTLDVVGTLTLVSPGIIESDNYVAGSTGWRINSTGAAEFNTATIRGAIFATSGTITNITATNLTVSSGTLTTLTVNGFLTMGSGGLIRTASSGERVEISNNLLSDIQWFNSGGSSVGTLGVSGSSMVLTAGGGISLATGGNINLSGSIISCSLHLQMESGEQIRANPGNASVPGVAFRTNTSAGMYLSGSNLAWSTAGTGRIIVGSGFFGPISDNVLACGSSGNKWTAVWAVNGTIQTSDERMKQDVVNLDRGLDEIRNLLPKNYRWQHDPARLHRGFTAQDLMGGPFQDAVWEEDGEVGLAYHEFIAPLVNAVQELADRIEVLEGV